MDDNDEIIRTAMLGWYPFKDALESRLAIGVERYGHGVRVNDDTTQWGTKIDSWLEMGLEEIDDLAIYVIAQFIRDMPGLHNNPVIDGEEFYHYNNRYAGILKDLRDVRRKIMDLMENNG
tara:strand:- start:143 stop:502 length:360 start_codon:yes stop_codon:yes gene_type:complete